MASASQIKAGEAFIQISADSTEFQKQLTGLQKSFDTVVHHAGKVGLALSAMGGSVLAPITLATRQFVSLSDSLDKMSARTGASTEDLSALGFAAERSGASIEAVDKAAKALYASMDSAARGKQGNGGGIRGTGAGGCRFRRSSLVRAVGPTLVRHEPADQ